MMWKGLGSLVTSSLLLSFVLQVLTGGHAAHARQLGAAVVRAAVYVLVPVAGTALAAGLYRLAKKDELPGRRGLLWALWFLVAGFSAYGVLMG